MRLIRLKFLRLYLQPCCSPGISNSNFARNFALIFNFANFLVSLLLLWFYLISNRQFSTFRLLYHFFISNAFKRWMIIYVIYPVTWWIHMSYTRHIRTKIPWEQCLIGLIFWNSKDINRLFWNEESRKKVVIQRTFLYKVQNLGNLQTLKTRKSEN